MKIQNSADLNVDNMYWTILVYGLSKTFKSRFCATWPNSIIFDFDNGMKSCIEFGVDYISYGSDPEDWVRFESDIAEFKRGGFKYDTIIFDSGTSMAELLLRKIMSESRRDIPTKHEYGVRVKILNDIISSFTTENKTFNFILVCHEDSKIDDDGRLLNVIPYLPGKHNAANKFDEVYHTSISRITNDGTPVPLLKSTPSRPYLRGSRVLIGDIENPTYEKFIARAKESIDKIKKLKQTQNKSK